MARRGGRGCVGAGVGREGGARGARLWRAGRSAAGGGDAAASDLQIKGGGARQGTVKGTAAAKATGLHLGQGGQGRLLEVGAPIDPVRREELTADAEEGGDVGPLGAGAGMSLHRQSRTCAPAPGVGRLSTAPASAEVTCRGDLPAFRSDRRDRPDPVQHVPTPPRPPHASTPSAAGAPRLKKS